MAIYPISNTSTNSVTISSGTGDTTVVTSTTSPTSTAGGIEVADYVEIARREYIDDETGLFNSLILRQLGVNRASSDNSATLIYKDVDGGRHDFLETSSIKTFWQDGNAGFITTVDDKGLELVADVTSTSTATFDGAITGGGFLTTEAQGLGVNALTRKDYVDGEISGLSSVYLGINDTAADSDKLGGELPSYYASASDLSDYVLKAGDTMTGPLIIDSDTEPQLKIVNDGGDKRPTIRFFRGDTVTTFDIRNNGGIFEIRKGIGDTLDSTFLTVNGGSGKVLIPNALEAGDTTVNGDLDINQKIISGNFIKMYPSNQTDERFTFINDTAKDYACFYNRRETGTTYNTDLILGDGDDAVAGTIKLSPPDGKVYVYGDAVVDGHLTVSVDITQNFRKNITSVSGTVSTVTGTISPDGGINFYGTFIMTDDRNPDNMLCGFTGNDWILTADEKYYFSAMKIASGQNPTQGVGCLNPFYLMYDTNFGATFIKSTKSMANGDRYDFRGATLTRFR